MGAVINNLWLYQLFDERCACVTRAIFSAGKQDLKNNKNLSLRNGNRQFR
jgi:hypothetical protein